MAIKILSKNSYLKIGVENLYSTSKYIEDICVIDLSSYNSLTLIQEFFIGDDIDFKWKVILLTGKNVCSKLFSTVQAYSLNLSVKELVVAMRAGIPPDIVAEHIINIRNLESLTNSQRSLVKTLLESEKINEAAEKLCVSNKIIYHNMEKIASTLGLRSGKELMAFLLLERQ